MVALLKCDENDSQNIVRTGLKTKFEDERLLFFF